MWGIPSLDTVGQDVRYGLRLLRQSPVSTAVCILSLAIGIGASAAVFSLADALLFRTLAVGDPERLVLLKWASGPASPFSSMNGYGQQRADGLASTSFSLAAFQAMRSEASRFVDVLGFADLDRVNVGIGGSAELATAHVVSGNYFDVLDVTPAIGRAIGVADDSREAAAVAVISDTFWQRRFGRSTEAIGRPIVVNGVPFTIAGVTPRGFAGTGQVGTAPDLFVPLAYRAAIAHGDDPPDDPNFWWVLMLARLEPNVTAEQARSPLDLLLKRTVAAARPQMRAEELPRVELLPGSRGQLEEREGMRAPLRTMAIVVGLVLLVACANVANLLLARGRAREREISVRCALGAGRQRLVRQMLTEGAVLAAAGAALGVAMAGWLSAALLPAVADHFAVAAEPRLDRRLMAFSTILAAGCALLFALLPAFKSTNVHSTTALRGADRASGDGRRRAALAGTLVVVQIGLSMVLVVTAGLLVRSVRNLERADLGFDPDRLLIFRIDPTLNGLDLPRVRATYAAVLDRLRAAPGVESATLTSHTLIANSSAISVATRESEPVPERGTVPAREFMRQHSVWTLAVDPGFFTTFRVPMLRGRALQPGDVDGAPRVAVVNAALARQLFQTDDVVGRRFRQGMRANAPLLEIVGVAADAAYTSVRGPKPPTAYVPYLQQPLKQAATFAVRTRSDPSAFAESARRIVGEVDPNLPLFAVGSQQDQVGRSLRQERLFARLATLIGAVALGLSAIGLYGLMAYSVTMRVREIGIRMALGARRGLVGWMVLQQSLVLAAIGLTVGIAAALLATRLVESMIYGLPPRDPVTFAMAAAVMLSISAFAGYFPARRAASVDPLVALRSE